MNLHISKSKNAESFYICRSYVKANGSTSSMIVRKLGTLEQLLVEHGPTRDDVLAWAKNEVKIETEKYKKEKEAKTVLIPFHADRQLDYDKQVFYRGGYLFLQSIYYQMQMNKICRKLKQRYKFKYDINAILSDLIYARILEPCSKRSSYKAASEFLEKPSYELHDVYRALDVLGAECDLILQKSIKTAISWVKGMIRSSIMTVPIITLRSNRKTAVKNTGRVKSTGQTQLFKWGCSWMETGFPLPSPSSRERKRADIAEAAGKESPWGFRMPEIYLLQ